MSSHPLATALFELSPDIRYVAIREPGGEPRLAERAGIVDASSAESDFYEEAIVNPTVLTLLEARGAIGCGGLEFVLIRYGRFMQFVTRLGGGHLSVSLETTTDPMELVPRIRALATSHARA